MRDTCEIPSADVGIWRHGWRGSPGPRSSSIASRELRAVAARPRLKIADEAVTELIERIERYGERVDSDLRAQLDCRDQKDNYVLAMALALAGSAEIILSEDDDLLMLDPWRGIRVMRLFQFLRDHPLEPQ